MSNLQLYVYYAQYPKDWIVYKVSVSTLPHPPYHILKPASIGCGAMVSHNTSNPDRLPNKSTCRLLDGLNLVFTIHGVYYYVVRNFGKYDQLDVIVWSFKVR